MGFHKKVDIIVDRLHLLYGLLGFGLAWTYIALGTHFRLQRYVRSGQLPAREAQILTNPYYALMLLVGLAGLAGATYILTHPLIRSLDVPKNCVIAAGCSVVLLFVIALVRFPGFQHRLKQLDQTSSVAHQFNEEMANRANRHAVD